MVTSLFLALSFLSYTSSNLPSSVSHRSTYIRSLSNFPEAFSLLNHLNSFAYPPPLPISYFFILPRFTPNLMKCNHLSPTALCLCSWTKPQSQSWGPQQSTPYCFLFPAVRQLFPPFSMKPPDPLLLLPFRPCVLLHWKKKERKKEGISQELHRLSTTSSALYSMLICSPGDQDKKLMNPIPSLGHCLLSLLLQCFSYFSEHQLFPSLLSHFNSMPFTLKIKSMRSSLVVQWLRLHTPKAGARVQSLIRELDPAHHN